MGNMLKRHRKANVICVGLDNSGKSTIINQLKPAKEKVVEVQATVGFSADHFQHSNMQFSVFDMSGQGRYRNLWEYYYKDVEGIIFVIDSSDTVRMCVVKDELDSMFQHKDMANRLVPVLFYANKMDLPQAVSTAELTEVLELERILGNRPFHIAATNALTAQGLESGLQWFGEQLSSPPAAGVEAITVTGASSAGPSSTQQRT